MGYGSVLDSQPRIPLLDLKAQHAPLRGSLAAAFERVMDHGNMVLGAEVAGFESALSQWLGDVEVVGVSSGTDALLVALMALGIGPGDEVVTTPFTFVATASAALRLGATVRFADVQEGNLMPSVDAFVAAVSPRTRAVIAVDLFGEVSDLEALQARLGGVPLVEDAAQSLGARRAGKPAGGFGRLATLSFFPAKTLGGFGDGGAVVTRDAQLAELARRLRVHGARAKYEHAVLGGNFRLDALQAALLSVKLPWLEAWRQERQRLATRYDEAFAELGSLRGLHRDAAVESAHGSYTLRVLDGSRDVLRRHLDRLGIDTAVHYPRPLHLQPCFEGLGYGPGAFPVAELMSAQVLSLPLYPGLAAAQQARVIHGVRQHFGAE